jgi:hypothetical protein
LLLLCPLLLLKFKLTLSLMVLVVPVEVVLVVVMTVLVAMEVLDLVGKDAPTKHSSLASQWISMAVNELSELSSGSRRWNRSFE